MFSSRASNEINKARQTLKQFLYNKVSICSASVRSPLVTGPWGAKKSGSASNSWLLQLTSIHNHTITNNNELEPPLPSPVRKGKEAPFILTTLLWQVASQIYEREDSAKNRLIFLSLWLVNRQTSFCRSIDTLYVQRIPASSQHHTLK